MPRQPGALHQERELPVLEECGGPFRDIAHEPGVGEQDECGTRRHLHEVADRLGASDGEVLDIIRVRHVLCNVHAHLSFVVKRRSDAQGPAARGADSPLEVVELPGNGKRCAGEYHRSLAAVQGLEQEAGDIHRSGAKFDLIPGGSLQPVNVVLLRSDDNEVNIVHEFTCHVQLAQEFPGYTPVYSELAALRLKQGRTEDAIEELSRGLEVAPNDPVLLNNAGVCLLLKGDYHDALGRLTAATEVVPHSPAYQANKALALGMLGLYSDSLDAYEQVLKTKDAQHNLEVIRDMWAEDIEE